MAEKFSPYLEQHLEPERPWRYRHLIPEVLADTLSVKDNYFPSKKDYTREQLRKFKESKIESENFDILLRYSPLLDEQRELIGTLVEREYGEGDFSTVDMVVGGNWRSLDEFVITSKQDEILLSLEDVLQKSNNHKPSDKRVSVIFPLMKRDDLPLESAWQSASHYPLREESKHHIGIVPADLSTLEGILLLLHETGHLVNDYKSELSAEERERLRRLNNFSRSFDQGFLLETEQKDPEIYQQAAEHMLRSERDAWAFALKKIRPLLRELNVSTEEISRLIHEEALQGYSREAQHLVEIPLNLQAREKDKILEESSEDIRD